MLAEKKPHHLGHRQRLRARFLKSGANSLQDYELLEMILFMAQPRADTKPMAKDLMAHFGTFSEVITADIDDLKSVKGVSDVGATTLKAIEAAALKLKFDQVVNKPVISSWHGILDYVDASLKFKKEEEFRVLFLDRKNKLLADELQQQGTVDQAPVYPREIIKRALHLGASAIIMVHNHPSGDPQPSPQDIELTNHVADVGGKLGVRLHDHVIIGKENYASFKTMGLL